jgi:phenylpropionate dioxygenase-like ring-hydroxylating dioxygenase large terminal subunit
VKSYPVVVEKNLIWTWLWPEDPLTVIDKAWAHPEFMVRGIPDNSSTYTRDFPYGWDMLIENIIDPSHVPFAHHGLQGSRIDAIPINMSTPADIQEKGFDFTFQDRTMGRMRDGWGDFRAPYVVQYAGEFGRKEGEKIDESNKPLLFNLTVVMIPTKPGWSRGFIYGGRTLKPKDAKEKESLFAKVFRILPVWLIHQFNNRVLDSDLAFLHYQGQKRERHDVDVEAYFMPAQSDRCIVAFRKWIEQFAHVPRPLPAPITDRDQLFDRWNQHTDQCRHCSATVKGIQQWRRNTYLLLALNILLFKFPAARLVAVACLGMLRILAAVEKSMNVGEFKHYENQ